jgi:hypothetical protein
MPFFAVVQEWTIEPRGSLAGLAATTALTHFIQAREEKFQNALIKVMRTSVPLVCAAVPAVALTSL